MSAPTHTTTRAAWRQNGRQAARAFSGPLPGPHPGTPPPPADWIPPARQLRAAPPEAWRTINRFRDYQVSNLGRFRNVKTGREIFPWLNSQAHGEEYWRVGLTRNAYRIRNGRRRLVRVRQLFYAHRLVAIYHVAGRGPHTYHVDHRNRVKAWNWAVNLRWCTPAQNLAWRHRTAEEEEAMDRVMADCPF